MIEPVVALTAQAEIRRGERFEFGANWTRFLRGLSEERIAEAERSLREMLERSDLTGLTFLDIGCGSGLFSLVARRLGATVRSFDYDPQSVACARQLRARFLPDDPDWMIEEGSILDAPFVRSLGKFDIVYSWGVLHHTGALWPALANACGTIAPSGQLWVALYNHQPFFTPWWRAVKRGYLRVPSPLRPGYVLPFFAYVLLAGFFADLCRGTDPRARFRGVGRRGMSLWRDLVDWVGGWPFETATPEELVDFVRPHGLSLTRLRTVGGRHGCNEYLLTRLEPGE